MVPCWLLHALSIGPSTVATRWSVSPCLSGRSWSSHVYLSSRDRTAGNQLLKQLRCSTHEGSRQPSGWQPRVRSRLAYETTRMGKHERSSHAWVSRQMLLRSMRAACGTCCHLGGGAAPSAKSHSHRASTRSISSRSASSCAPP